MFERIIIVWALHIMKYYEQLEYYVVSIWLCLPSFVFGFMSPTKFISYDDDDKKITGTIYINKVVLIVKNENSEKCNSIELSHAHLLPLIIDGQIMISDLKKYYPRIDTIILSYNKLIDNNYMHIHRVVDIAKKYDLRNLESCSSGIKIY